MILIIKHVISEGPGLISDFFKGKNRKLKVVELEKGEEFPKKIDNIEAVISMGGPMNVYEEKKHSFLKKENKFVKEVIKKQIPFLGICLGAQILAKAAGARVKKGVCKEIGWFKVNLAEPDYLFSGLREKLDVFQWHEDEFEIPESGVLIAKGDICRNQAFKLGKNAYGLQFHIEAKPSMIKDWLGDDEKIIKETYEKNAKFLKQANKIFENFYQVMKKVSIP